MTPIRMSLQTRYAAAAGESTLMSKTLNSKYPLPALVPQGGTTRRQGVRIYEFILALAVAAFLPSTSDPNLNANG